MAPRLLCIASMTRSYASRRARHSVRVVRPPRDPSITVLGFECFRLEGSGELDPVEPAYVAVRLFQTRNAMGAFMLLG